MRLFGFELNIKRQPRNSSLASPEQWLVEALLGRSAASGVKVTPLATLGVPTVLACVNAVSRTMSSLPLKLYRNLGNGGKVLAQEHYLYDLLNAQPIPGELTSSRFVRAVQSNATLRNSGSALIVRNGLGEVSELVPIEPVDLTTTFNLTTKEYEYRLRGQLIDSSSLLTVQGLTFNGFIGADPLLLGREAIGLTIALQDNAARFFGNGSRPGAVLTHPMSLSEEAQDRLRKSITATTSGEKANSLLILEEGMKYEQAARSGNQESQFDESRARQDKAIARIFGVPQSKIGILDDAHYNNVEQENLNYVKDTILPWAVEWEQQLNMKLLRTEEQGTYYFKFNLEGLMRGDMLSRYQAAAIARNWGWLNVDEIRAQEEMDPLPDGNGKIYLQPLNMQEAGAPLDAPTNNPKLQPAPKAKPTT
jgi:HK97 family phage portal protein